MKTKKALSCDEQRFREIEKAVSKFSQHLMSNSKWIRLIETIVENANEFGKIQFKKIQNDNIGELYINEDSILNLTIGKTDLKGLIL